MKSGREYDYKKAGKYGTDLSNIVTYKSQGVKNVSDLLCFRCLPDRLLTNTNIATTIGLKQMRNGVRIGKLCTIYLYEPCNNKVLLLDVNSHL